MYDNKEEDEKATHRTDGQIVVDTLSGVLESGTWAATGAAGLSLLTRTTNNNTTEYFMMVIPLKAQNTSGKGMKITSVEGTYSINTADTGDNIQFHLIKRVLATDGTAQAAIVTVAGDADADYDAAHNTAAKRVVDTDGPEEHTFTMTVPTDDQLYIEDDEVWLIRIKVIEADDATGALAVIVKDLVVNFSTDVHEYK